VNRPLARDLIGVVADPADFPMVEEFFELFKTPWERADPEKKYPVILIDNESGDRFEAERFLVYGSQELAVDRALGIVATRRSGPITVEWTGSSFPLFRDLATFGPCSDDHGLGFNGQAVNYRRQLGTSQVLRLGYDLFHEIRHLLSDGQPALHARTPTLDLHIALLRATLVGAGMSVVEIPARPYGYDFAVCLTHDVDFFGIRRHRFDRTLAGFVARASVGTFIDLIRGRRPLAEAVRNWAALLTLPLVLLNLVEDPWQPFDDYARVEHGSRSTFFVVPFKGKAGVAPDGTVHAARAVAYQASDVREEVSQAAARQSEIAVHGIDAWRDAESGRAELRQVTTLTGAATAGVRMHWLYFAAQSPRQLEAAGFEYDSSWGYNEAVGYRAGTSQVFRLPDTEALMELPLSIMDSALFYRHRMDLSASDAWECCRQLIEQAKCFGGTLVINWHDRSLAPERLWDQFYQRLLQELGAGNQAWFATARQAVSWFRWRRSFRFTIDESGSLTGHGSPPPPACPAARLRITRPTAGTERAFEEFCLDGCAPLKLDL
jgi:hypothetical protein